MVPSMRDDAGQKSPEATERIGEGLIAGLRSPIAPAAPTSGPPELPRSTEGHGPARVTDGGPPTSAVDAPAVSPSEIGVLPVPGRPDTAPGRAAPTPKEEVRDGDERPSDDHLYPERDEDPYPDELHSRDDEEEPDPGAPAANDPEAEPPTPAHEGPTGQITDERGEYGPEQTGKPGTREWNTVNRFGGSAKRALPAPVYYAIGLVAAIGIGLLTLRPGAAQPAGTTAAPTAASQAATAPARTSAARVRPVVRGEIQISGAVAIRGEYTGVLAADNTIVPLSAGACRKLAAEGSASRPGTLALPAPDPRTPYGGRTVTVTARIPDYRGPGSYARATDESSVVVSDAAGRVIAALGYGTPQGDLWSFSAVVNPDGSGTATFTGRSVTSTTRPMNAAMSWTCTDEPT